MIKAFIRASIGVAAIVFGAVVIAANSVLRNRHASILRALPKSPCCEGCVALGEFIPEAIGTDCTPEHPCCNHVPRD